MKTNKFWFVMAAAAILTGMTMMTSCSKDDEPELPEVIESEVLDEGIDATVKENVGTEGTQLSYESWIVVKGQTRAAFENKVAVTLNNVFNNVSAIIPIRSFDIGDYTTNLGYKVNDARKDAFVTINDSVLVYNVKFREFSFDYNLCHEVAFYNDGITKQTMPFHQIESIKDNGYKLIDLEFITASDEKGTYVYVRKMLKHSITVTFNGSKYTIEANIELRINQGTNAQPRIVSSKLLNSGISNFVAHEWSSTYTSWAEVEHRYSDGSVSQKKYEVDMRGEIEFGIKSYKELPDANVVLKRSGFNNFIARDTVGHPDYIMILQVKQVYNVEYNHFSLDYPMSHNEAKYDDGVLQFELPCLKHENVREKHELRFASEYTGPERDYKSYFFTQEVFADFGEKPHYGIEEFQVLVYTE